MPLKWKRKRDGAESQCGRYRIAKTAWDFPCDCCGTIIQEWGLSVKDWKSFDKFRSLRDAKEWAEKVELAMLQPVPDRGHGYCSCGTPLKKRAHLKCMLCYFEYKGVKGLNILDIYPELLYPQDQPTSLTSKI